MRDFINLCKMTQPEVKAHMKQYLTDLKYNVVDEDGFLYAKGDVPVLLVAHMDTVHKAKCTDVVVKDNKISSPQGIGGDDRCGVYIISEIVKGLRCSVLLCEDEEIGTIGARKFVKTDYINNLDVNYMIEFDRKGSDDAVFYSCDNKKFIDFVTDATGFNVAQGSFSDISVLMPAAKLSAVNLSSGYYNPHTITEFVDFNAMNDTIYLAMDLIETECAEPFEYVAKEFKWQRTVNTNQSSFFDMPRQKSLSEMALEDLYVELEVLIPDELEIEKAVYVSAKTKAECWTKFFLENPDISFNDIVTYSWC